ncbi:hypothetical protein SGI36_21565, partial [Providencia rettgeri]
MTASKKPQAQYLTDYQAPDFNIEHVDLTFKLIPLETQVTSILQLVRTKNSNADLILDGIDLTLLSVQVDGDDYA